MIDLEHKFIELGDTKVDDTCVHIEGYASLFAVPDQSGDVVHKGAYAASLKDNAARGQNVKMLWQHDPSAPIGVWDVVQEDAVGLFVKGRILTELQQGREASALIEAGAIDGLSIGYRTRKARAGKSGRELLELELWEVSLVTFAMLPEARLAKGYEPLAPDTELASAIRRAAGQIRRAQNPQAKEIVHEHN